MTLGPVRTVQMGYCQPVIIYYCMYVLVFSLTYFLRSYSRRRLISGVNMRTSIGDNYQRNQSLWKIIEKGVHMRINRISKVCTFVGMYEKTWNEKQQQHLKYNLIITHYASV